MHKRKRAHLGGHLFIKHSGLLLRIQITSTCVANQKVKHLFNSVHSKTPLLRSLEGVTLHQAIRLLHSSLRYYNLLYIEGNWSKAFGSIEICRGHIILQVFLFLVVLR